MNLNYLETILEWCKTKIPLSYRQSKTIFREGEIWWCSIGMNVGEEVFGKGRRFRRPVLVFKKFTTNSFLGLPLTSRAKEGSWYVPVVMPDKKRWAMLAQARTLDKKRFGKKIGKLDDSDFNLVIERFFSLYNPFKIVTPPPDEAGIDGQSPNIPSE